MHHPTAEEFVLTLLEALNDLPPDFIQRFAEALKETGGDRSQAIRQLFEDFSGE
jgi:hypothetical protein